MQQNDNEKFSQLDSDELAIISYALVEFVNNYPFLKVNEKERILFNKLQRLSDVATREALRK